MAQTSIELGTLPCKQYKSWLTVIHRTTQREVWWYELAPPGIEKTVPLTLPGGRLVIIHQSLFKCFW